MQIPIILLSGMAADERLFAPQIDALPNLHVQRWITPFPQEPLRAYVARLARIVDPGCPCIVGGASFGGIVATELATTLQAKACLLISSVRSPHELPWRWRALRPLSLLGPEGLGTVAQSLLGPMSLSGTKPLQRRLRRFSEQEAVFLRWACWTVLRWYPSRSSHRIPQWQIHGDRDQTLPIRRMRPDVVVTGGGHLLPLTHASIVNDVLRRIASTDSDERMIEPSRAPWPPSYNE